jgi:hypothetical protein
LSKVSKKVTGSQDDVFCGELEMQTTSVFSDFYCLPNKLALMERSPGQRLESRKVP